MKIQGLDGQEFRAEAVAAADHLMSAALPRALSPPFMDVSVRMGASLGLVAVNALDRINKDGTSPEAVEEFLRSYGGAMGFVATIFPAPTESAVLVIHYMLDYLRQKHPRIRHEVLAALATIELEGLIKKEV